MEIAELLRVERIARSNQIRIRFSNAELVVNPDTAAELIADLVSILAGMVDDTPGPPAMPLVATLKMTDGNNRPI